MRRHVGIGFWYHAFAAGAALHFARFELPISVSPPHGRHGCAVHSYSGRQMATRSRTSFSTTPSSYHCAQTKPESSTPQLSATYTGLIERYRNHAGNGSHIGSYVDRAATALR